jgi:nuclear pore complex protein Nup205
VNILLLVTSYPTPPGHLLAVFTSTATAKQNIRHGFVSCLEADEEDVDYNGDFEIDSGNTHKYTVTKTKMAICQLLLQCLNQAVPNVAHYLFGFDLNKEIKKTVFQQPGLY